MFRRPLAFLAATVVDYLIWRLSAGSGLQLVGLVSGLLLLPLLFLTVGFGAVAVFRRAADGSGARDEREESTPGTETRPAPEKRDERQERLAA